MVANMPRLQRNVLSRGVASLAVDTSLPKYVFRQCQCSPYTILSRIGRDVFGQRGQFAVVWRDV